MRGLIAVIGFIAAIAGAGELVVNRLYPTAIERCQALSYERDGARCAIQKVGQHGVGFFVRVKAKPGETAATHLTRLINADVRDAHERGGADVLTAHPTVYLRAKPAGKWQDRACTTQGCEPWHAPHPQADKYFPAP
jgi:hypothetical protein